MVKSLPATADQGGIGAASPEECPVDRGRWCVACGGELAWARRWEDGLLLSYLQCMFCGNLKPMLSFDPRTWEHQDLTKEPVKNG